MIYDREPEHEDDLWTTERFKDELFLDLVKVTNGKYYKQAEDLMFKIPLTEHHPSSEEQAVEFQINFKELSPKVQKELKLYCKSYNKVQVKILLKQVILKLFENLDYKYGYSYAHMSVMKKLRVKVIG